MIYKIIAPVPVQIRLAEVHFIAAVISLPSPCVTNLMLAQRRLAFKNVATIAEYICGFE